MPIKKDVDASAGEKLLRLFRKLMLDGRKHFQLDLAEELNCSPQTIIRLMSEIESVVGISLESGIDQRKKWYQIKSISRSRLGLDFEELRYLAICRDLAEPILPTEVLQRIDDTLFNLSVLMADHDYAEREKVQGKQYTFCSKGKIDYTPHFANIEKLTQAIEDKRICLLKYKACGKDTVKEHRFAPNKIVAMNNALYVLGATLTEDFLHEKHFLNFAIHRIADVILLERSFTLQFPEIDTQSFGLPWHEPRAFSIRFVAGKAADYVRERVWASEQRIEELDDGGLILHITTRSEPELMAWVRSFGDGISIISI